MHTVETYLKILYQTIRPGHVVEIGADPTMELIAKTAIGIPRISVVDFTKDNEYKRGWWDIHRGFGINLERVDGDARNLSGLINEANVVYSHVVAYSSNEGEDILTHLAYRRGERELSDLELETLMKMFNDAETTAIKEACIVASKGHVVWFTYNDGKEVFDQLATKFKRPLLSGKIVRMCGENVDDLLNFYHLEPPNVG